MTASPALPRVHRRVRPGLVVLLAVSLALALHALWDHIERRRLVREIDAVLASGAPVARAASPPSAAATRLAAAAVLTGDLPSGAWSAVLDQAALRSGSLALNAGDDAHAARQALLASGRMALALADEATALPFSSMDGAADFPYRTAGLAQLSRLVALRTLDHAHAGRGDDAAASAVVGLVVRRAVGNDGVWAPAASPGDVLSRSAPGDTALRAWAEALERAEDPTFVSRTVAQARARTIENVWRLYYGPSPATPTHQTLPRRGVWPWLWRPWFSRQFAGDLREWAQAMDIAGRSHTARAVALAELEEKRRGLGSRSVFVRGRWFMGLWPTRAWDELLGAARRDTLAADRSARAALAIERYRRAEADRLPQTLDALAPRFLDAVPMDPYADGPLRYRQTASGYVVYSVGPNLADDGGRTDVPPVSAADALAGGRPGPLDVGVVVSR